VVELRNLHVVSKGAVGTKVGLGVPDLYTAEDKLSVLIRINAQYNTSRTLLPGTVQYQ
jgi:hypothetical protein